MDMFSFWGFSSILGCFQKKVYPGQGLTLVTALEMGAEELETLYFLL